MAAGRSKVCKQVFKKSCIKLTDMLLKTIKPTGNPTKLAKTVTDLDHIQ